MRKKMKNIIAAFSAVFVLLLVIIGVNASADANEPKLKSVITNFELKNVGTGYDKNITKSFLQKENGFDDKVVDEEGNFVIASGDTISYEVSATIAIGLKRQVDFSFTIPKELTLDTDIKSFCGADKDRDSLIQYAQTTASFENNVLKCSFFADSDVAFDPLRNKQLKLKAVDNTGKVIVVPNHVSAKVTENGKSVTSNIDEADTKIKIISVPSYDVKILPEKSKLEVGISYKEKTDGTIKINSVSVPKGGSFEVIPYPLTYKGYHATKGYADMTEWSAVVDLNSNNFPKGTEFFLNGEPVTPINNKITIPKNTDNKAEISFVLPYEKEFNETFKAYGDNALKNPEILNKIGKDAIDRFFDKIFGGENNVGSNYVDGKYVGGYNDLSFNANVVVDKDSFKTPDFENINGLDLPGNNKDKDFPTKNYEIDGVAFNSAAGNEKYPNNKYNGFTINRYPDVPVVAEEKPDCTKPENETHKLCTPVARMTASHTIYRPWVDNSTNFEKERIKYDNISDENVEGQAATGSLTGKVVTGNEFKDKITLTTNGFFTSRKKINNNPQALVLTDQFDYNDMKVIGKAQNIKYPADYLEEVCDDDKEICLNKIIVQVGLDKTDENKYEDTNASGWKTVDDKFNEDTWDSLVKEHTPADNDNKVAMIRVIYPNAFYTITYKQEEVKDKDGEIITPEYTWTGEAIYAKADSEKINSGNEYSVYMPMKVSENVSELDKPSGVLCSEKDKDINDRLMCNVYDTNLYVSNKTEDGGKENNVPPLTKMPIYSNLTHIYGSTAETELSMKIKGPKNTTYQTNTAEITQRDNTDISVQVSPVLKNTMYLDDQFKPTVKLTIDACIYDIDFKNKENDEVNNTWKLTGERKYRCDQRDEAGSQTVLEFKSDYVSMRKGVELNQADGAKFKFKPIEFDAKVSQLAPQYEKINVDGLFKIESFILEDKKEVINNEDVNHPKNISDKNANVNAEVSFSGFSFNRLYVNDPVVEKDSKIEYESIIMTYDKGEVLNKQNANNIIVMPGRGNDLVYDKALDKDYLLSNGPKSSMFKGDYKLSKVSFDKEDTSLGSTLYCTTDKLPDKKIDFNNSEFSSLDWIEIAKVSENINSESYYWDMDKASGKSKRCVDEATALRIEQPTYKQIDEENGDYLKDLSKLKIEILPEDNKKGDNYLMWLSKNQLVSDVTEDLGELMKKAGFSTKDQETAGQERTTYPVPKNAVVVSRDLSGHVYWAKNEQQPQWEPSSKGWVSKDIKVYLYEVDKDDKVIKEVDVTTPDENGKYEFKELLPGYYQVKVVYPKNTEVSGVNTPNVSNVFRAYNNPEFGEELVQNCNGNYCEVTTTNNGLESGANKIYFAADLMDPSINVEIDDVNFGFYAKKPIVDIMKEPALPNCEDSKTECTINWLIMAKNDGINQLNNVEIVDTMSSQVELLSAEYKKVSGNQENEKEVALVNKGTQHDDKGFVKRIYTFAEGFEFNPNDKVIIEITGKVKRGNKAFNIGNQVYINSAETIEDGKIADPTFDLSTLPEVEKFNPLVSGKWTGNETCSATEEWAEIGKGDQCDQVYAGIPEAGNVGYLEGNVWDTGYENRNTRFENDTDVRFAKAELYKVTTNVESEESENNNDSNLEFVEEKMVDIKGYYFFDNVNPEEEYAVKISYGIKREGGGYYYSFVDPARGKLCLGEGISCAVPADYYATEELQSRNTLDTTGVRVHEASKGAYVPHLKVQPFSVLSHVNAAIFQNKTIVDTANPSLTDDVDCDKAPEVILPELEGIKWNVKHDTKNSKYVVTAEPTEGYAIKEGQQTTWELTYKINPCPIPTMPTTGNQSLFYVLMAGLIGTIGLTSKVVLNNRKY